MVPLARLRSIELDTIRDQQDRMTDSFEFVGAAFVIIAHLLDGGHHIRKEDTRRAGAPALRSIALRSPPAVHTAETQRPV